MNEAVTSFVLQQFGYGFPILLVYIIGFVFAAVFLRRQPAASLMTMFGTGLLMLLLITSVAMHAYLIQRRNVDGLDVDARLMWSMNIAVGIGRAIGLALIVAAVFVGRGRTTAQIETRW